MMKTILALILVLSASVASAAPVGPLSTFLLATPCRAVDTRQSADPLGNDDSRLYVMRLILPPGSQTCGVPVDATGVVINITATQASAAGHFTVWGGEGGLAGAPGTSALNFPAGGTVANQATVLLGPMSVNFDLAVLAVVPGGTVHVIIDVVGFLR